MKCEHALPLLAAYADGELDTVRMLEMEDHLQACPTCTRAWRELQHLKKSVRQESLYHPAPAALRRRVLAKLKTQTRPAPKRSFWSRLQLAQAFSSIAIICLASLLIISHKRPSAHDQLTGELVSSHIRSLMANHALDVISTDQHTVKPWFNGRVDFAPPVKDLAAQGFPLIGGRLDYVQNRSVAALVFQRHKHFINVFIWPGTDKDSAPAADATRQGFNLIHWSQGGMTCWAVSDLNQTELLEFARDFAT
jgi:anti-sigma factor (TIGR02949 family)